MVRRVGFSVAYGFLVIALLMIFAGVLIPYTNPDKDPVPLAVTVDYAVVSLLYWPSFLLRGSGLDCPNADSIADKLRCIALSLTIDFVVYSALCFALLRILEKRRRAMRFNAPE